MIKFKGIYKGKEEERSLKGWCELTNQKYDTVKVRYSRLMKKCKYKLANRINNYRNYAFLKALNKGREWNELVLYDLEDFLEKVYWLFKVNLKKEVDLQEFIKKESHRLKGSPMELERWLKEVLKEKGIDSSPEELSKLNGYYHEKSLEEESLGMMALGFGLFPDTVRHLVFNKGYGLRRAFREALADISIAYKKPKR